MPIGQFTAEMKKQQVLICFGWLRWDKVTKANGCQRARLMMANENTASFMKGFALHIISRR